MHKLYYVFLCIFTMDFEESNSLQRKKHRKSSNMRRFTVQIFGLIICLFVRISIGAIVIHTIVPPPTTVSPSYSTAA